MKPNINRISLQNLPQLISRKDIRRILQQLNFDGSRIKVLKCSNVAFIRFRSNIMARTAYKELTDYFRVIDNNVVVSWENHILHENNNAEASYWAAIPAVSAKVCSQEIIPNGLNYGPTTLKPEQTSDFQGFQIITTAADILDIQNIGEFLLPDNYYPQYPISSIQHAEN